MTPTTGGLWVQGATLDQMDPWIDIGEVEVSLDQPAAPKPSIAARKTQDVSFCPPSAQLRALLLRAYLAEPPDAKEVDNLEFWDGLWWARNCIFVPLGLRPQVLLALHDGPTLGHPRVLKTLDLFTRTMYWPRI
jgi:hypothetical protein